MKYGHKTVKPESIIFLGENVRDREEVDIIPLRGLKGLIWGFYSPSPWMVWLRLGTLPYGVEVTRYGHLAWWKRYNVRILKAKG